MKRSEIKKLDALWSKKIHERGNKCELCGRSDLKLEAMHIVGRKAYATRWRLDNGLLVCFRCHQEYDQHRNYTTEKVKRLIGEEKWNELQTVGNLVGQKYDYYTIKNQLESKNGEATN